MWDTILICTIILIVVILLIRLFKKVEFQTNNQGPLYPFSSDLRFDPFPTQINISNPYECSGTELHPCRLDNQLSCIGCQSLVARCTHFASDITYFDDVGEPHTIPANTDENDGYCMTITNDLNVECNVFHGDLALIKIEPDSAESMFFCNCKNPGFIGNTSILGACDTPFICNGNIDDINQPLSNINCECSETQHSRRNNEGLPMCVDMTIQEANTRDALEQVMSEVDPNKRASIAIFHPSIRQRLNVTTLLHPCKTCPLTKKYIDNGIIGTIEDEKFCSVHLGNPSSRNSYFGIPYRRSPTERLLVGDHGGPDAVLGVYWHEIMVYDYVLSDSRQIIIFQIEPDLNEDFYNAMGLDTRENYWIYTDNLNLGLHLPTPRIDFRAIPGTTCWVGWPAYDCTWGPDQINGLDEQLLRYFRNEALEYIAPDTNSHRMPRIIRHPPMSFVFDLEAWRGMQDFNQYIEIFSKLFGERWHQFLYLNGFRDVSRRTSRFAGDPQLISYGFRRKTLDRNIGWMYTMYTNYNPTDWLRLENLLIPFG